MIIIAREFAVSGLRTLAASEGVIIAASNWGKTKTVNTNHSNNSRINNAKL